MAITTTRINGTCSLGRGYTFYANVLIWDTINNQGGITVQVNTYLVNGGTRTNSSNWTENITIANVGQETLTGQTINTSTVDRNGGQVLVQSKSFSVPITMSYISVSAYASRSSYSQYDPGYCSLSGSVPMPKIQSTWGSSLLSIANIENAFTLPINKYVDSYYNVVEIRNSNDTTLIKTINNAVNGTSVTLNSTELNTIYTMDNNRNQLPLVFYMNLKTYTDSSKTTQVGTTQRLKCEAYIVNGNPTATYTIVEQDAKVIELLGGSSTNKIIKNASDLLFTITPTALKGATIKNVKVNDTNATLSSGNYVLNVNNITTGTFNIVITDSRNLTQPYQETKTIIDYLALAYNSWSIKRYSQTSSDLVLNADITCYSSTIDGNTNTPVVKYSIDNENWTTISSSDYTFQDNKITITNLTLQDLIDYQHTGTFYLKVTDLLGEINDNKSVAVGIYTMAKSDRKVRINGTLEIADSTGQNRKNVMEEINKFNSNIQNILCSDKTNIQSTSEQTLISTTLDKGTYLFTANIPVNYLGAVGREINTKLYINNTNVNSTNGVINTYAYTISRTVIWLFNVTSDNTPLSLKIYSTTTSAYDVYSFNAQILRLK